MVHSNMSFRRCKYWLALALLLCTGVSYRVLVRGDGTCTVDSADLSCGSVLAGATVRDDRVRREVLGRIPEREESVDSSEVFFSVKTAGRYHASRLSILLLTWLQTVHPHQIHIVTDSGAEDEWTDIAVQLDVAVVGADCPIGHSRQALCCKSGVEYDQYYSALDSGQAYRWFCHFDDDIYVNVPALMTMLHQYNSTDSLYLGRWSVNKRDKMEIPAQRLDEFPGHKRSSFYFATGAAYCISSPLMVELEPYLRGASFVQSGDKLMLPDDMTIGAIIDAVLGHNLTEVESLRSHLLSMRSIRPEALSNLVTFGYGEFTVKGHAPVKNVITIPNAVFTDEEDPTSPRFKSEPSDIVDNELSVLVIPLRCLSQDLMVSQVVQQSIVNSILLA